MFPFYCNQAPYSSEADKESLWWIANKEILMFTVVSHVAAVCDGVCISKGADLQILVDGLCLLVPMQHHLACWIDDFSIFAIVKRTGSDLFLSYVAFRYGQEVV